jgi:hypothetical protein
MALSQQDLTLALKLDPHTDAMAKAIKELGSGIDEVYKDALKNVTTWDTSQAKAIRDQVKGLQQQRTELEKIRTLMEPDLLKEQLDIDLKREVLLLRRQKIVEEMQEKNPLAKMLESHKEHQKHVDTAKDFQKMSGMQKISHAQKALEGGEGIGGKVVNLMGSGALGSGAAAAAGPAGMAIAAAMAVKKALVTIGTAPAKAVGDGLEAVSSGLHELQGPLGPVGLGFSMLTKGAEVAGNALKLVSPVIGKVLAKSAKIVLGPLKEITQSLVSMVQVASPGAFKLWTMALEDVQGVIGQSFTPVLEMMTEGVGLFGDVLATVLPNMDEMNEILNVIRPAFEDLKNELKSFFTEFGATIRQFISQGLMVLMKVLGAMMRVVGGMVRMVGDFMRLLGMSSPGGEMRSSRGAAARPTQMQGLEEYSRQLQLSAFMGPGGSPQDQQVSLLGQINVTLNNLPERIAYALATILSRSTAGRVLNAPTTTAVGIAEAIYGGWQRITGG